MKRFGKTKKTKGMTLVEIIISLFIFTLLALILVRVGVLISNYTRSANHVNRKTVYEAPVAAAGEPAAGRTAAPTEGSNIVVHVNVAGKGVNLLARQYSTAPAAAADAYANTGGSMDLEFCKVDLTLKTGDNLWVEPTTEATT